jgi:hypothetical protein
MVDILKTISKKDRGIYIIWSNIKPEKMYIGSSINLISRCNRHFSMLKNNKHYNKKLQNHVNKYGVNDLQLCLHMIDNNLTTKELRNIEYKEIKNYDVVNKGFNLIYDENFVGNYPKSKEQVLKISKARREDINNKVINILQNSKIIDTGTVRFISDKYKLDNSSIYKILAGKRYKHKGYTFK